MRETMRMRGLIGHGAIWIAAGAVIATNVATLAQVALQPRLEANQRQVVLVRQDTADCAAGDIPNVDSPLVGGTLWATQLFDGNTSVKLAMTGRPNTVYRVTLKCVRPLGDVTTDDDGVANVSFAFPTNLVGPVYSFELTPGAGPGDKYQSAQVKFQ
jgi:hypothetical protein